MNEINKLPTKLALIRDQLIDEAYGRKAAFPKNDKLWDFYEWLESSDAYLFEAEHEQYYDLTIDASYQGPDDFSDKEMISEGFCEPEEINDALRIQYFRDYIDALAEQEQHYVFSIQIKNDNNEVALIGGTAQCNGQGNDTINWVYGAYKTEDEFRKCFESDDLNRISDEEILKRFKKNRK
jgi:hypothetical protein